MGDSYREELRKRKVYSGYGGEAPAGPRVRDEADRPWGRLARINAFNKAQAKPKASSQLRWV